MPSLGEYHRMYARPCTHQPVPCIAPTQHDGNYNNRLCAADMVCGGVGEDARKGQGEPGNDGQDFVEPTGTIKRHKSS